MPCTETRISACKTKELFEISPFFLLCHCHVQCHSFHCRRLFSYIHPNAGSALRPPDHPGSTWLMFAKNTNVSEGPPITEAIFATIFCRVSLYADPGNPFCFRCTVSNSSADFREFHLEPSNNPKWPLCVFARSTPTFVPNELICDRQSVLPLCMQWVCIPLERQTICGVQRSTNLNHNIDIISPRLTLLFTITLCFLKLSVSHTTK